MSYCWVWVTLLGQDTHRVLSGLSARRSNACEAISRIEQNFSTLRKTRNKYKKKKNLNKVNKNVGEDSSE